MQTSALPVAGQMNRRIWIKLWSDVPNAAFGIDQAFDTGIKRWAKHEPVHGLAIRAGMQTGESPTDLFWVRRTAGTEPESITASHVVEYNGFRYRVLDAIDVDGARKFTRITTKQLGAI